jgi:hypothetical protein
MSTFSGPQAIAMAEKWTKDLGKDPTEDVFVYTVMQSLLAHIRTQSKDIEGLTVACQLLFRENRRLRDALDKGGEKV